MVATDSKISHNPETTDLALGMAVFANIEMMAKHNRVFLDEDNFIHINVVGQQTYNSVWHMGRQVEKLAEQLRRSSKPILIFDDLQQMDSHQMSDVRKAVAEVAKQLDFDKVAMVGAP